MLVKHKHPVSAYQLLDELVEEGHKPAPPTIYRALDFLVSHGLAHKIESLNAFMACPHAGHEHRPMIMICTNCSQVAEFASTTIDKAVAKAAKDSGFTPRETTVEVTGLCSHCRESATA